MEFALTPWGWVPGRTLLPLAEAQRVENEVLARLLGQLVAQPEGAGCIPPLLVGSADQTLLHRPESCGASR